MIAVTAGAALVIDQPWEPRKEDWRVVVHKIANEMDSEDCITMWPPYPHWSAIVEYYERRPLCLFNPRARRLRQRIGAGTERIYAMVSGPEQRRIRQVSAHLRTIDFQPIRSERFRGVLVIEYGATRGRSRRPG
jgi:hypothetical protein